jgi:hypothetical protein
MTDQISLLAIYDKVAAIDSKVEALIARVDERLEHGTRELADHETRIRKLEQFKYLLLGGAGVIGGAAGWVAEYLASHR